MVPAQLYRQAGFAETGPAPTLEALTEAGFFEQKASRQLADKITEYWYTGVYDKSADEQAVATFVDALTFKAIAYAPPLTICGQMPDFWEQLPDAAPMPPVHTAGLKKNSGSESN